MLRNTFVHIPGVGRTTERRLWDEGCHSWEDLLASLDSRSLGTAPKATVKRHLEQSVDALATGFHQFFTASLGASETWRAYAEFKHSCVYLDIETDGGSSANSVTTIGIYDGQNYKCLVQGEDLENFRDIISHYSMVVTFFGNGFDLPVLRRLFGNRVFDQIHIDLCPVFRKLGYRGGLKKIEQDFGIVRSPETAGLTGYDAVLLWRRYRLRSDNAALERLIAYNREDTVNLQTLAEAAYSKMRAETMGDAQTASLFQVV